MESVPIPPGTKVVVSSFLTGGEVKSVQIGSTLFVSPSEAFVLGMGDSVKTLVIPEFDPFKAMEGLMTTKWDDPRKVAQ